MQNEDIKFEVRIMADTGFFEQDNSNERRAIDFFATPENSKTLLIFIASKKGWEEGLLLRKFKPKNTEYEIIDNDNHIIAKTNNLEDFMALV